VLAPSFLARFGILVTPNFIDRKTCELLRAEMLAAQGSRATVTVDLTDDQLDEEFRRTTIAGISPASGAVVLQRLLEFAPALEQRFDLKLAGCEQPQFLIYREGDFIGRHSDGAQEADAPQWLRQRALSAVLFLSDQSERTDVEGTFQGGALTFYGLLADDPRGREVGFPIRGTAGSLVVFGPNVVHAVTPVLSGERCTAVTWFKAAGRET
jgi:predicted 2-oxoglutarate/Fe(II)-dependent dioxygenase YbiX